MQVRESRWTGEPFFCANACQSPAVLLYRPRNTGLLSGYHVVVCEKNAHVPRTEDKAKVNSAGEEAFAETLDAFFLEAASFKAARNVTRTLSIRIA